MQNEAHRSMHNILIVLRVIVDWRQDMQPTTDRQELTPEVMRTLARDGHPPTSSITCMLCRMRRRSARLAPPGGVYYSPPAGGTVCRASACVAAAVMIEHFLESAAVEQAMTGCVHYSPPEGAPSVQRASACVAAAAAGSRRIQASSNGRCAVCRVQTHPVDTSQNLRHC
jgi:hypothetical protein